MPAYDRGISEGDEGGDVRLACNGFKVQGESIGYMDLTADPFSEIC